MPRITRFGHDRSTNLRAAPNWLSPEKVGRLIGWMNGIAAEGREKMTPIPLPEPTAMDPADVPAVMRPDCERPSAKLNTRRLAGRMIDGSYVRAHIRTADEEGFSRHGHITRECDASCSTSRSGSRGANPGPGQGRVDREGCSPGEVSRSDRASDTRRYSVAGPAFEVSGLERPENGSDTHSPLTNPPGASGTGREPPSAVSSGTAPPPMPSLEPTGMETAAQRRSARAPHAKTPDQPVVDNRQIGGQSPVAAAMEPRRAGKSARLAAIREAADRLASRTGSPAPKPSYAPSVKPESQISGKPDWVAERHRRLASAIAFLKSQCILVSVVDRDALVRMYRMSGNFNQFTAEQVMARAEKLGWEASK